MNRPSLISIWIGLSVGHFAYQLFTHGNYEAAAERSFVTGCTLLVVWFFGRTKA
jgi:hypothetical protein